MKKLQTLTQLAEFIQPLLALHDTLDGLWEPESTREEFLQSLINRQVDHDYYGELDPSGEIVYFAAVRVESDSAFFWLFYVNKKYRQISRNLIDCILTNLKKGGVSSLRFSTSNVSLSYERWVKKLGASKKYITYQLDLSQWAST